jgi:NADPH:quinone reductase-like Zn-dependent oxidoreductase
VIDYKQEDFTEDRTLYDLIFVANGDLPISTFKRALKPGGICVVAGGSDTSIFQLLAGMIQQWWILKTENKKISSFLARINQKDLEYMSELLASGKVKPVIDRRYPLSETADALSYLGEGHAQGKIVIVMDHSESAE